MCGGSVCPGNAWEPSVDSQILRQIPSTRVGFKPSRIYELLVKDTEFKTFSAWVDCNAWSPAYPDHMNKRSNPLLGLENNWFLNFQSSA